MRRSLSPRLIVLLALLLAAVPTTSLSAHNATPQAVDDPPFTWWMEPRYEAGWLAYNPQTHTYPFEYVYPSGWQVGFDACEHPLTGIGDVSYFVWHIEGVATPFDYQSDEVTTCRWDHDSAEPPPALPAQGDYTVSLTLFFNDLDPVVSVQTITIRDLLIISIGDSNASGEGNPHVNQAGGLRPANDIWFEPRCHRSANSGHAFTAAAIERDDPHSSVTFLSFACSGAEIFDGLIFEYDGIENPDDDPALPPQLLSIVQHLCQATWDEPGCLNHPRTIDSLFISIGVNDVGFSGIMAACVFEQGLDEIDTEDMWIPGIVDVLTGWDWEKISDQPVDFVLGPIDEALLPLADGLGLDGLFGVEEIKCGDDFNGVIDTNLSAMWNHYELLDAVIDGNAGDAADTVDEQRWMSPSIQRKFRGYYGGLPEPMQASIVPAEVYITSYPSDPLQDSNGHHDGCGFFDGLDSSEAAWLGEQGVKLNQEIEWEAQRNRWHYVGGITEAFERHGYCADDESFYVQFVDSILGQGNYKGVIHPNGDGHRAARDRILDTYYGAKPDWRAHWGVRVVMEAVRVSYALEPPKDSVPFKAKIYDSWVDFPATFTELEVPVGEWFALPEEDFRYRGNFANDQSFHVQGAADFRGSHLIYAPTRCFDPSCEGSDVVQDAVGVNHEFTLANGWGRDFDWCELESGAIATKITRVCTDSTVGPDQGIELRYRVTIINLSNADPVAPGSDNWQMCGWSCASGPGSLIPPLAAYIEVSFQHGADIYDLAGLLARLEEQVAAGSMWSTVPPAMQQDALMRVWARTDKPVADEVFLRTWMWGPRANSGEMAEAYAEAPNGFRIVQYFDKARMEVTHPDTGDPESVWYVTNGLLVTEMISGRLQRGDATFEERTPAQVNVAGDFDDPLGPTYATFGHLLDATPAPVGSLVTQRLDRAGVVTDDPSLATQGVSIGAVDEVTNHSIAAPFWSFMNASGTIYEGGAFVTGMLFQDPNFATGRPITEPYWANVKVGGVYRDVLMQCFERRCLTYTPSNDPVWQVEAGNVGQHYFRWRYD